MTIKAKKDIDRVMGWNLKRMRDERGWSQEQLAEMVDSDRRYISAMENGRGIGSRVLARLCGVLGVEEKTFVAMTAVNEGLVSYQAMPDVLRMLLDEVQLLPEYEQLRLLADLKERKARKGV